MTLLLPVHTCQGRSMEALRHREKTSAELEHRGSSVWPVVGGFQVVVGPDFETNTRRVKTAVPVVARSPGEGQRKQWALKAWALRNAEKLAQIQTPPVMMMGAPAADPPLRQLSLWEAA